MPVGDQGNICEMNLQFLLLLVEIFQKQFLKLKEKKNTVTHQSGRQCFVEEYLFR